MNNKNSQKATGADSKFFTTNRKGENHELREELRSPQRDRKRDAVKKVILNYLVVFFHNMKKYHHSMNIIHILWDVLGHCKHDRW